MAQDERADPLMNVDVVRFEEHGETGLSESLSGSLYLSGGDLIFRSTVGTITLITQE